MSTVTAVLFGFWTRVHVSVLVSACPSVQNPNASAVTVEVSYLKAGGGAVILTSSIPANSRMTFNMADKVPSGRASVMVTSKTAGKKIMVERAMYWNNRGAGTDTIGGYSD
jgi:hypothetical protein